MLPSREAIKDALPFVVPVVRAWHRHLTAWRSRPAYVARRAPFLTFDAFDQVFFDNRGNHPTQHLRTTARYLELRGAHVLALGCRDGLETRLWTGQGARQVTALDYVPRPGLWNELHHSLPSVRFLAGDARALPFADDTFDLVSSESLLEHVRHPANAIDEMHRVVRPGGLVFSIFGPLYFTAGGAHYEGQFEHLLMDHPEFVTFIERRNNPLEHGECLTYLRHDMFSYWTADQYLEQFRKHEVLRTAVFLSPDAERFRNAHPSEWGQLTARYSERDLLISGLALWSRKSIQ